MVRGQLVDTDDFPAQVSSKPSRSRRPQNTNIEFTVKTAHAGQAFPLPPHTPRAAQDPRFTSGRQEANATMDNVIESLEDWEPIPSKGKVWLRRTRISATYYLIVPK